MLCLVVLCCVLFVSSLDSLRQSAAYFEISQFLVSGQRLVVSQMPAKGPASLGAIHLKTAFELDVFTCVCALVHAAGHRTCVEVRGQLTEVGFLSLHCVGPRDETQVIRL